MARTTLVVSGATPSILAAALNARLATLTTSYIVGVEFITDTALRRIGGEYSVLLTLDSGSPAINPFRAAIYIGQTNAAVLARISAAYTANPGYFYAPPKQCYFSDSRGIAHLGMLLIYNSVLADGNTNYIPAAPAGGLFQRQLLRMYGAYASGGPYSIPLLTTDTLINSVGISAKAMYFGSGTATSAQSVARYPDLGVSDFCNPPPDSMVIGFGYDYDVDTVSAPLGSWDVPASSGDFYNLRLDLSYDSVGGDECDYRVVTESPSPAMAPWTGVQPVLAITDTKRSYETTGTITGTYSLAGTGLSDANISMAHTVRTGVEYAQTGMVFGGGTWSCNTNTGVKIVRMSFAGIVIAIAIGYPPA